MLENRGFNPHRPRRDGAILRKLKLILDKYVSILTAPEGTVLFLRVDHGTTHPEFQSSPPPKGRCYRRDHDGHSRRRSFNPHRPRRDGAISLIGSSSSSGSVSILTAPEGTVLYATVATFDPALSGFNPHRPRRDGAMYNPLYGHTSGLCFNPHRPRRDGAIGQSLHSMGCRYVSILTAPEGTVLCVDLCINLVIIVCFNPHRPRRDGAITPTRLASILSSCFNPHRPRRDGAILCWRRSSRHTPVSILTAPEGTVL